MSMTTISFIPALPEIFLLSMVCIVLLTDLFVQQSKRSLTYALTQITLVVTFVLVLKTAPETTTILFNGHYIIDNISCLLKLFILAVGLFAFIYARNYINEREIPQGDYYLLGLFSTFGMLVLVSAYSLLTLFIGLELVSLPLYAMVALQRNNTLNSEAAMKYFVMGSLASGMLLYGFSILYGATHSILLPEIAHVVANSTVPQQLMIVFGLILAIAGIAFKLGAVPFHMWVPDVYQGAPTSVTLFVGSLPKIAAVGMALRLLIHGLPTLAMQWQELLMIIAIASIALGNVVAIVQTNIKRMLSYSAISHVGYMALGLLSASPEGYSAAVFYIFAYAIMSMGAFALLIALSKAGLEIEEISDLRGLNARNPWLAFMMLLIMFSMAGIPLTVGFFAKLGVLQALVSVHMVWLATLVLVFAIIGAYYYLNVVKVMYFEEPDYLTPVNSSKDVYAALSINGLIVLALGIFPSGLIELCRHAFLLKL